MVPPLITPQLTRVDIKGRFWDSLRVNFFYTLKTKCKGVIKENGRKNACKLIFVLEKCAFEVKNRVKTRH